MPNSLKIKTRHALEIAIAFMPWLVSIYLLYWFEVGEIWTLETPHRDKMTIAILVVGMGASFLLRSYFVKREQK